jgi:hypothetical protein
MTSSSRGGEWSYEHFGPITVDRARYDSALKYIEETLLG